MVILRERVAWRKPAPEVPYRTPEMSDAERESVRAAVRFLRVRFGGDARLAKALGVKVATLRKAMSAGRPSAALALRVAIVAGVNPAAVIDGRWPPRGACALCGHVTEVGKP
jgi:hypothetical protein